MTARLPLDPSARYVQLQPALKRTAAAERVFFSTPIPPSSPRINMGNDVFNVPIFFIVFRE